MTTPLVVVGGGEHARVVVEAARSQGRWTILGFVDPQPWSGQEARLGAAYLGGDEALDTMPDASIVLGVGALGVSPARGRIVERLGARRWATVVHERAWVSPSARVSEGAVIFAGAVVQAGATVGAHVVIGAGSIVEHDVTVGELAQVAPGAVIGGGARIGRGAFLGLGARVRDHVSIGDNAMVAMGAVVVDDVIADTVVMGVPAKTRLKK